MRKPRKPRPRPEPHKAEILAYLSAHLKDVDTLTQAYKLLDKWALSLLPAYRREWVDELDGEVPLSQQVRNENGHRLPAIPTREEVQQLLAAPNNPGEALVLRVLYSSGLRAHELVTLVFADLSPPDVLFVRSGKEDRDRYVLIDPVTVAQLVAWQGAQGPDARIFPITTKTLERMVTKWGKRTGLTQKYAAMGRHLVPHSLRHAFATHCLEGGMDLVTIKRLMGHASLEVTEEYLATSTAYWRATYHHSHPLENPTPPGLSV